MVSYLLVIDWVMRKALEERNTGIRWRFTEEVEDLDFVDDLALLSNAKKKFQLNTDRLFNASQEMGPKINIAKTKVMRFNAVNDKKAMVNGKEFEDLGSFVYL